VNTKDPALMTDVFDKQELLEELDDDLEFLAESLEILDSDAPELLKQIRAAVDQGDAESLSTNAHTLKSMVGNFAAKPAFEAALHVENIGREGDLSGCRPSVEVLEKEVGRLRAALHEFLVADE
jgi:two-component system sensor histidine kinase/response regulator